MADATERFVQRMAGAFTQAGLPRVPSLVFCALLADDDGQMTSAELVAALGISPASVSGAVRYLAQVGMLRRERERGSRRDRYVVDEETWHNAVMRTNQAYAPLIQAIRSGLAELPRSAPSRDRLEMTQEFLEFVDGEMLGIAERWEKRRARLARQASSSSS